MVSTCTSNPHVSISPKDCSNPVLVKDFKDKSPVKFKTESKTHYDSLSEFRFPKGSASPISPTSTSRSSSYNSNPSSPSPPLKPRRRLSSHTRSSPVSLSSNESIFSSYDTPPFSKKLDFDNSRRTSRLDSTEVPVIDLDIISKPLRPRKNADSLRRDSLGFFNSRQNSIIEEDEELEDSLKNDKVIMMDFLRENVSEKAMSVTDDYDPLDYVKQTVWIDGIEKDKKDARTSLFN